MTNEGDIFTTRMCSMNILPALAVLEEMGQETGVDLVNLARI